MKKKGFTLIELLAVIVILAIILVIAVPQILNVIEKSEMQAYKESVELMVYTAKMQYQMGEVNNTSKEIPEEGITYMYGERNNETVQTNKDEVGLLNFKGDKPSSGTITLTKERKVRVEKLVSKNKKYCAIKEEDSNEVKVGRATSEEYGCIIEEVKDKTACELEEDEAGETLYVDSVSDLYELSRSVNNGNTYEGKVIKLRTNLDMNNTSYSTTCGEESFKPIGTSSHPFKGTFDGGAYTISNLTINMPGSDNVGLFGYAPKATIYGLQLDNISVSGKGYVGTLIGNGVGSTIKEIVLKNGNVTATDSWVGGIAGTWSEGSTSNIIIRNININSTNALTHLVASNTVKNSIIENAAVTCGSSDISIGNSYSSNNYYSNLVSVNNENQKNGLPLTDLDEINFYDSAGLDTWIGGDNDNSGYYFDYEDWTNPNSKIVLKTIKENPMTFRLKGAGTKENPYLISSESDWRDMTTKTATANVYYKLTANLNFETKKFYEMGNEVNSVTGITLEGGAKTISNVTVKASKRDYVGMFGRASNSTIYGLNLDNISVSGKGYVGTLIGNGVGSTIKEIVLKNGNVTATDSWVGGIAGTWSDGSASNIIIRNINISSTDALTHLVASNTVTNSIIEKATITGNSSSSIGGSNSKNNYYSNLVTVNGVEKSGGFDSSNINNLEYYSGKVQTSINGDTDSSGYYFDYVDSLNGIYVVEAK